MGFPSLGNSDHVVVSVSIDFPSNSQRDAFTIGDNWESLRDHLRDVPWEDIYIPIAFATARKFL